MHGGAPCHYCGQCGRGCDTASFFCSADHLLPDAIKTGKLEIRSNAVAARILRPCRDNRVRLKRVVIVGRRRIAPLDDDVGVAQCTFWIAPPAVGGRAARHPRRECLPESLIERCNGGHRFVSDIDRRRCTPRLRRRFRHHDGHWLAGEMNDWVL